MGTTGLALVTTQSWATAPASEREPSDTAQLKCAYQTISQLLYRTTSLLVAGAQTQEQDVRHAFPLGYGTLTRTLCSTL